MPGQSYLRVECRNNLERLSFGTCVAQGKAGARGLGQSKFSVSQRISSGCCRWYWVAEKVIPSWCENISKAKEVCRLLRSDNLAKLLSRCYSTPLAKCMHPFLKQFRGHIHEGRWGTVAFTVPELLKVRRTLQFGWDIQKFVHGDNHEEGGDDGASNMARVCDEAIRSESWWAFLQVVEKLCVVLRKATLWLECCPCHEAIRKGYDDKSDSGGYERDIPKPLLAAMLRCPLRCRRAPELSAGELLVEVDRWCQVSCAQLATELSRKLSGRERRGLLQDMEAARTHLMFYLTTKMAYLDQEPWCVVQVAADIPWELLLRVCVCV